MIKYFFSIIVFFMILTAQAQITMTTQKQLQRVLSSYMEGHGYIDTGYPVGPVSIGIENVQGYISRVSIDWGDGQKLKALKIFNRMIYRDGESKTTICKVPYKYFALYCYHNYDYDTLQFHTITVKGRHITIFDCCFNELTSLYVSKNTKLKGLRCTHNKLTSLDLSKNTHLEWLNIDNNLLSSDSLNLLFETLQNNKDSQWKTIRIDGNPGVYNCDVCIAEKKRWSIYGKPLGLKYGQPIDSKVENECE